MKVDGERITEIDRKMEEISVDPAVRYIGELASFKGIVSSLHLEYTNIEIIDKYAFAHCYQLENAIFPTCLREICEGAFFRCENLINIKFKCDSQLMKIGGKAFQYCPKLNNFEFPPLLESIGECAFDCCNIRSFDLRWTRVRQIGLDAFARKSSVALPATVTPKIVISCYKCRLIVDEKCPYVKRDDCGCFFVNGIIIDGRRGTRHFFMRRGVEKIGKHCFYESNLASLTIPASVLKISKDAFYGCTHLKFVHFAKNSQMNKIGKHAFCGCSSLLQVKFPKKLKIIKFCAFKCCISLKKVSFPSDSQLERIEEAFPFTSIKYLSLPQSTREIQDVCYYMKELESVYLKNDLYSSNIEGTAIYSRDGSELVCIIPSLEYFKVQESTRAIRKNAFLSFKQIFIPASVEVIEEKTFSCYRGIIEFESGSKLKPIGFESIAKNLKVNIRNSDNIVSKNDEVLLSKNPNGIYFVPDLLTNLNVDPNVEVIFPYAFEKSIITSLVLPKSLKKIYSFAFFESKIRSITFEEGTDIETLGRFVFKNSHIEDISLRIKGKLYRYSSLCLVLPPDFSPKHMKNICPNYSSLKRIICPKSSLSILAQQYYLPNNNIEILIIENR